MFLELDKTGKFTQDKSVNEEKETAKSNEEKETVESKVDNVKEYLSSITSIIKKGDIVNASITSIKNKSDKFDRVDKSRTTSVSNKPNKITQLEKRPKPSEVIIPKDNLDVSVLTGSVSSLASVTPEEKRIPRQKKIKETAAFSILRVDTIQETVKGTHSDFAKCRTR